MFPMRVVVEAAGGGECATCAHTGTCVVDAFTMLNGQTSIDQLVAVTLNALGLGHLAAHARGLVEVNNWKAISLDSITDLHSTCTTEALLKDVSTHATLKIITKQ